MIDPKKYDGISAVAKLISVSRTTLRDAAARGDVESVATHGGTVLVNIAAARRWRKKQAPKDESGLF